VPNRQEVCTAQVTEAPGPPIDASILQKLALDLGFVHCAVASIGPAPHWQRFRDWLDEGLHGQLQYLERGAELRRSASALRPSARSLVSLALASPRQSLVLPCGARLAAFASAPDYHQVMRERLHALADRLGLEGQYRVCVDSAPLLERSYAAQLGMGQLGRSGALLSPSHGAAILLGELLFDRAVEGSCAVPPSTASPCGACTQCVQRCPTGALRGDGLVDAGRCLSALSIEWRGSIPRALRVAMGAELFGCDHCSLQCPYTQSKQVAADPSFSPLPQLAELEPSVFLSMGTNEFRRRFAETALLRTGVHCLARNACVVLGNLGLPESVTALEQCLLQHPRAMVREHAAWALGRYVARDRKLGAQATLRKAQSSEKDTVVQEEIALALNPSIDRS
jgi:epoxyqueuosine reductase